MVSEREQLLNRIWQAILDAWHEGEIEIAQKREQLYTAVEQADDETVGYVFLKTVAEMA